MAIFKLNALVTVSAYTVVEAENIDEAMTIARDRSVENPGLGYDDDSSWIMENDGEPQDIREDAE